MRRHTVKILEFNVVYRMPEFKTLIKENAEITTVSEPIMIFRDYGQGVFGDTPVGTARYFRKSKKAVFADIEMDDFTVPDDILPALLIDRNEPGNSMIGDVLVVGKCQILELSTFWEFETPIKEMLKEEIHENEVVKKDENENVVSNEDHVVCGNTSENSG